jgi:hypothetical protein
MTLFITWHLYYLEVIFNFLHTKIIFRDIFVRTGTFADNFQNKSESVGI